MNIVNKIILILLLITSVQLQAQVDLTFDKRFVECEDKWVAFQMDEDSIYTFGFIYIDSDAGLTLNSEGSFKLLDDGSFEINKLEETSLKIRLEPNNVTVAVIPDDLRQQLEIEATPEWLKHYKTDVNTIERHYKWGFMYNAWNECQRALPFLLKAKAIDPDFEGLIVEIAYSYNCMKEYSKAIEILEEEIIKKPKDAYINKEYIYSITKTDNIEKAIKQYNKSQKEIKDNPYSAENCFNLLQFYYKKGDKKKFKKWYKELIKLPVRSDQVKKYADLMKSRM